MSFGQISCEVPGIGWACSFSKKSILLPSATKTWFSWGQVALEDKTVYLCQKSVITMKNQVRPVCPPKDKIWSQTDKLQRCRRLPLEQAKLKQILENNSEGVLIRKWFDRWYVAESLCDRLRGKIDNVLISQQHESRRGRPIFSAWNGATIFSISTRMDLSDA